MSEYRPVDIEKRWQAAWREANAYRVEADPSKPKFYVLDMFPYPSGAGLHVGHPLGYIATDIVARYKMLRGYNVLHPMGFDAFGLPAEQYAIQTGQHPARTTAQNIARYKEQLDNIGFGYDWSREVQTCDPAYYKWTQWIFLKLFGHYYDKQADKALPIENLVAQFEKAGNAYVHAAASEEAETFSAQDWQGYGEARKEEVLQQYRLAYQSDAYVNWCPGLGTVLANEEVKDGFSVRGGFPVERKLMRQWMLRITAYAQRLLDGLDRIDWSDALKEQQRNWIGLSHGALLDFAIEGRDEAIRVFTTRIDTIFGVTFVTLAPEHELVRSLATPENRQAVEDYIAQAAAKSELDRKSEVKTVSGVFTGSYAVNPVTGQRVPIWVGDYVLAGYGTGAVMGVPGGDTRDYAFASHFSLPIVRVMEGERSDISQDDYDPYAGTVVNSEWLNGLTAYEAIEKALAYIEEKGLGKRRTQFRLRDAIASRQRYWGEPIPIYFENGIPRPLPESALPLELPEVEKYLPTEEGEPPLARAKDWQYNGHPLETTTMPGWAGSSWYYLRYMDPKNNQALADKAAMDYWGQVDLYVGGSEHATGHLLYSRFWCKFLKDIGVINFDEPFQKLVNQGMIQGMSALVWKDRQANVFTSANLGRDSGDLIPYHVDVSLVEGNKVNVDRFRQWRPELDKAVINAEASGEFLSWSEVEKMSKSLYNVVNPDDIVARYGADTLRLYEMFLGPLEQSKPWSTQGIEGVSKFLRRFFRLFWSEEGNWLVTDEAPAEAELKVLHRTLKKVADDIERLQFNTSVSGFMICLNELYDLKTHKRAVLEPLVIALSPFAPHLAQQLWVDLGHAPADFVFKAAYPSIEEQYLQDDSVLYPISINGKKRAELTLPKAMSPKDVEAAALADEQVQRYLQGQGQTVKKVIVVPGRIVNLVAG